MKSKLAKSITLNKLFFDIHVKTIIPNIHYKLLRLGRPAMSCIEACGYVVTGKKL